MSYIDGFILPLKDEQARPVSHDGGDVRRARLRSTAPSVR